MAEGAMPILPLRWEFLFYSQSSHHSFVAVGGFGDGVVPPAGFHAVAVDAVVIYVVVARTRYYLKVAGTMDGGGYADAVEIADADEFVEVEAVALEAQTELQARARQQHGPGKPVGQALCGVGEGAVGMVAGQAEGRGLQAQEEMGEFVEGGEALALHCLIYICVDDDEGHTLVHKEGEALHAFVLNAGFHHANAVQFQHLIDGHDGLLPDVPQFTKTASGHFGILGSAGHSAPQGVAKLDLLSREFLGGAVEFHLIADIGGECAEFLGRNIAVVAIMAASDLKGNPGEKVQRQSHGLGYLPQAFRRGRHQAALILRDGHLGEGAVHSAHKFIHGQAEQPAGYIQSSSCHTSVFTD